MQRDRNFGQRFAPVKVGDELEVKIEAVGEKGDGIAKKDGFVLFVPNTKEGQLVKIKVTKVLRKVGFAEVVGPSEKPAEESEEKSEETEEPAEESEESGNEGEPAAEESEDSEDTEDTENFGEEEKEY